MINSVHETSLPYPYLAATATDADDGASEFSAVFAVHLIYLPLVVR